LQLTLTDLWAVDSSLAAGLQALLSFEEGAGSIEDMFGVNFTASANPLLGSGDKVSVRLLYYFMNCFASVEYECVKPRLFLRLN